MNRLDSNDYNKKTKTRNSIIWYVFGFLHNIINRLPISALLSPFYDHNLWSKWVSIIPLGETVIRDETSTCGLNLPDVRCRMLNSVIVHNHTESKFIEKIYQAGVGIRVPESSLHMSPYYTRFFGAIRLDPIPRSHSE